MNENLTLGFAAIAIGMTVVLAALGGLAVIAKMIAVIDRRLKLLERKPALKEESLDPRIVAAITAALASCEKRRFRIHRIRYLRSQEGEDAWQEISRAQQLISRQVRKQG